MSTSSRSIFVAVAFVLTPRVALAAEPTKVECVAANDAAQDLRRAGKLREAREKLAFCVSESCPGPVREDCAQRLTEVDHVMPSIVFEAKDGAGNDVVGVTATMDGQQLPGKLSGLPLQVDPGEHRIAFDSADGLAHVERTIVVREGEQNRHERVVLVPPGAPGPSTPVTSSSEGSSQKTIAYAVGGAGVVGLVIGSVLGLVSKSAYDHALQTECGNNPNGCSPQGVQDGKSAHSQAAASTVAFVAGGVLIGAGAVLYFTAPKSSVSVGTTVGREQAGLVVTGVW